MELATQLAGLMVEPVEPPKAKELTRDVINTIVTATMAMEKPPHMEVFIGKSIQIDPISNCPNLHLSIHST